MFWTEWTQRGIGMKDQEQLFNVKTPLGFSVRCSRQYWDFIVSQKHPSLKGHEKEIEQVLGDPDEIRRSRKDSEVYLFYQGTHPRWLCAVVRNENSYGFVITAYPTDAIKAGDLIWTKSK